jgi:hypothetical protein
MTRWSHKAVLKPVSLTKISALAACLAATVLAGHAPAASQSTAAASPPPYADLADLALAAPISAHVRVREASRIKPSPTMLVPAGKLRYLVTADVIALIRGNGGVPPQVRYLVDLLPDSNGKAPKLKKTEAIIFAAPVPKRDGQIQLVAPDAQLPLSAGLADRTRAIIMAATRADAPPKITGVGDAFHVAGTLPEQGETQIFLIADDGRPVSLSVWREPGVAPRWALSLDEIVDQTGAPPTRDTLLWYRLACFLPRTLPEASSAALAPDAARIAAEDYKIVIDGLGPCSRRRTNRG